MKIVKGLGLFLIVLILGVVGFGLVQPDTYAVSRSITIAAPAAKIIPLIAAPKAWKSWSIWNQRDQNMTITYKGPESGAGAAWDWKSESQGNGGMVIDQVTDSEIRYRLHFEGMGSESSGKFTLSSEGANTKVTWSMEGSNKGEFMTKLFTPFMDKLIGPDFSAGLENLKQVAEKN